MKRESIRLPDDPEITSELLHGSKNDDWEWIKEKITDVDLEKGVEDLETIMKRKSDGKYFRFEWIRNNYHTIDEINCWPIIGEEVFPKQVTKTVYE